MPRFIDEIRAADQKIPPLPPEAYKEMRPGWMDYREVSMGIILTNLDMPVILANNVAEYYQKTGETKKQWNLKKDFPNLAPQYPAYWIEYAWKSRSRVGVLVFARDPASFPPEWTSPESARWYLGLDIYAENDVPGKSAYRQLPLGRVGFLLDKSGEQVAPPRAQTSLLKTESNAGVFGLATPALLTICFLHCKNVKTVDNKVDPALAKKQREKLGFAPTQYKTLVIEPLKEILRTQGGAHETGLKRAMHICRGHFADYSEGAGLFGKYHGKFWIPATVRGTKKEAEKPPPREIEVKL